MQWFNENVYHRLRHLKIWSLVDGAIQGGLWCMTLLEEVCHQKQVLRVESLKAISSSFSFFVAVVQDLALYSLSLAP